MVALFKEYTAHNQPRILAYIKMKNFEFTKGPRLVGNKLRFFVIMIRQPLLGSIITYLLKKQNGFSDVVKFATLLTEEYPLYYPIHEMSETERLEHQRMIDECKLEVAELARFQKNFVQKSPESGALFFRHWTISDYTTRYTNRDVTPIQVANALIQILEDISERNPIVVMMDKDRLRKQAEESTDRYRKGEQCGIMDGVPILIKDEIPTVGYPVTMGTSFIAQGITIDKVPEPVTRLLAEGAMLIGKTNQHEIGIGTTGSNTLHGAARNPYNENYYTGGSSSGSGAAVAMGLVPLALGTDGGGSIRIPAALCGCVGLKATFKRIPIDCNLAPSLVHLGPIAGSITDAALAYSIMAGNASSDFRHQSWKQPPPHLYNFASCSTTLQDTRVGVFWSHIEDAEPNVVKETKRAIEFLRSKGAKIVNIELPHLREIHLAHSITILTEIVLYMDTHIQEHFTELQLETQASLSIGLAFTGKEFLAAQKIRAYAMRQIESIFREEVDVIVSPATSSIAPMIQKDAVTYGESDIEQTTRLMKYIIHGNMTGIPGIVFPCGYDDVSCLPISLQVQAAHWREDLLFKIARALESLLPNGWLKPSTYVDILGTALEVDGKKFIKT